MTAFAAILSPWLSLFVPNAPYPPLVRGVILGDCVFACGTWTECVPGVSPFGGGKLVLFEARSATDAVAHQLPIPIGLFGGPADEPRVSHSHYPQVRPWVRNPPLRWHVRGQRCHVLSIDALVADHGKPFGWDIMVRPLICSFDLLTGALWPSPHTTYSQEKAAAHAVAPFWYSYKTFGRCEAMVPGPLQHFSNAPPKRLPDPLTRPGRLVNRIMPGWQPFYPFDFLPLSDLVIEAYVLFPGGWLRPYTCEKASDYHGAVATVHPALRVDWSEPFHVVVGGERRFIITESGRVFVIPAGAKEGTPLERVRTNEPVQALISDPATGRSFAFTANTMFEVGETIAPRPHKLGSLDARTGDDVIATAARCARVVRALPPPVAPPPRERTSY